MPFLSAIATIEFFPPIIAYGTKALSTGRSGRIAAFEMDLADYGLV
jgi:hypothetical protein